MYFYIAYLVLCVFSKENDYSSRENLPNQNLQVNIFDKSKSFNRNRSSSQVILKKTAFNDEDCNNLNDTYINVDVKISECQSINKGISFISNNQEGNTISISNSIFNFSSSPSEKAMLIFQGTFLDIFNVTIKFSTEGKIFSSPIFECSDLHVSSSPSINSLTFIDCILDSNLSIFKLSNYPEIAFTDLHFEGESVQCKSILESDTSSSAQFNNCNFSNFNEQSTIFALNYIKGELNFASCNFFNNKCCLFYLNETEANLTTFDRCHFYDNNATNILSFIYLLGDQTAKTIESTIFTDCHFSNNFIYSTENSENRYGTVIGLSTSLRFEGTNKFTNCHTISIDQSDLLSSKNFGGALSIVHASRETYELQNCSFDGCSATSMGGGLFSCMMTEIEEPDKTSVLQLTNCNFTGCWSLENGGGISCGHSFFQYENGTQTELKITSSLFKGCKSPIGGGIFFNGTVEQAVLSSTTFDNCEGKNGTAFHIRTSLFTVENSEIVNHYAANNEEDEYNTTCIYLYTKNEEMQITFSGVHFKNNSGQSIEIRTPFTDQLETINTFDNCQFIDNNKFSENYTLINCERVQASITIFDNCSFIENRGRCISSEMIYCDSLMIVSCNFIGNKGPNGVCLGAYLNSTENKVLTLQSNVWRNNTASSVGIVCVKNIEIDDDGINTFKDNEVMNEGDDSEASCSSLYVELMHPKPLSLAGFIFENCASTKGSGAVFVSTSISDESASIDFTNFSFTNNRCVENGGAVFIETSTTANIIMIDSYFKNNTAKNGGSIFIGESSSEASCSVDISNCHFIEDEAHESGGSIFMSAKGGANIRSCNFTQTKASINGKAISIDLNSQVNLSECTIYVEKDSSEASAIYCFSSSLQQQNDLEKGLLIEGGCFRCDQSNGKAAFLIYNVSQESSLRITREACFQLSKEDSILIIGSSTKVDVDDSVFDCDDCDRVTVSETLSASETSPISVTLSISETPSISETLSVSDSASPSPDDGGSGKKKLSVGAVIGIVILLVAFICLAFLIIYFVRKRKAYNDDALLRSVDSVNQKYTV